MAEKSKTEIQKERKTIDHNSNQQQWDEECFWQWSWQYGSGNTWLKYRVTGNDKIGTDVKEMISMIFQRKINII